ncbi:MAG: 4Fe-4S dicluster domain-containing protein [Proteobacteria bacterium]|nr:4Fe-4S dicluster domain-containing protein [Pseudomonadota bacterium]
MKNRRDFLKVAGASALGLSTLSAGNAFAIGEHFIPADQTKKKDSVLEGTRWGMVIDTRKLTPEIVEDVTHICREKHNVPDCQLFEEPKKNKEHHEIKWIWEEHFHNAFPNMAADFLAKKLEDTPFLVLCNQCENPPCVRACPTKATFKRPDGIVLMDFHRCIGCRFCMAACPYGSRSFNFQDPRNGLVDRKPTNPDFPTRMKGVVEKCNFCAERLAVGEMPHCVEVSKGAITFGDIGDEHSEIRLMLEENYTIRRKVALGTGPSVFYIV